MDPPIEVLSKGKHRFTTIITIIEMIITMLVMMMMVLTMKLMIAMIVAVYSDDIWVGDLMK